MSPAKVTTPEKGIFFVPEGQYIGNQAGFDSLDESIRREMKDWGPGIFGAKDGFKMSGDMGHESWSIKVSSRGVTFHPPYIEQQATSGGSGFRVKKILQQ